MWIRNKQHTRLIDSDIIKDDFILAEGSTLNYSFLDRDNPINPFNRSLWTPVFYLFKVHKNHPINIRSAENGHLHIYPANEYKKKHPRMSAEIYKDKMDWDISTFLMVPFIGNDFGTAWKKYEIPEGFISASGEKRDSLLLYASEGNLHLQDSMVVSRIMPSQVLAHLNHWMYEGRKIISHEKTFNQRLEGTVFIPDETRWKILPEIIKNLEGAYKARLSFEK